MSVTPLERLAALHGIEPGYHDVFGAWHAPSEATQRALLAAMGVDERSSEAIDTALAEHEREHWSRVLPAVAVLRSGGLRNGLRIHLREASLARTLALRIVEESGEQREERIDPLALTRPEVMERGELQVHAFTLPLPADLPEGYHHPTILEGGAALGGATLVVAPDHAYLPRALEDGGRVWGSTVQLYGLRSARNAGIGDLADLRACA